MRRLVLSAVLVVGTATLAWSQTQQSASAPAAPDPANFTGKVTAHPTTDIRMLRYSFEPGRVPTGTATRAGRSIFVEQGRMRRRSAAEPAGSSGPARRCHRAWRGPLAWGAAGRAADAGRPELWRDEWMEKVTDEQYARAGRR